jgi:hypothetical protein
MAMDFVPTKQYSFQWNHNVYTLRKIEQVGSGRDRWTWVSLFSSDSWGNSMTNILDAGKICLSKQESYQEKHAGVGIAKVHDTFLEMFTYWADKDIDIY